MAVGGLGLHIALAPSVGQMRQKPTDISLSAYTEIQLCSVTPCVSLFLHHLCADPSSEAEDASFCVFCISTKCFNIHLCVFVCGSSCGCCATNRLMKRKRSAHVIQLLSPAC